MVIKYLASFQFAILAPIQSFSYGSFQNMMFNMFGSTHKFKVFYPVIGSVTILVMNMFFNKKYPAKMVFHHQSMFFNIAVLISKRMVWFSYQYVAMTIPESSSFPMCILFDRYLGALSKTSFITMIVSESNRLLFLVVPACNFKTATTFTISQHKQEEVLSI